MKTGTFHYMPKENHQDSRQRASYDQFEATELYCSECGRAVPVRKNLLLILPEGDKYEYTCQYCGSRVGDKIDHNGQFFGLLKP